jgi:teichuronic acid biosynthesis glycosyltransferase TuaC
MNLLIYVNFDNKSKAGLYRSVFSRAEQLKKNRCIQNLHMVSVYEDYKSLLKKISIKRGYINHLTKDEIGFSEGGIYCQYIKVPTYLTSKIIEKLSADYCINRKFGKLIRDLKIKDYDAISVHSAYPNACIAKGIKEKYKIPYIVTLHGSDINVDAKKSKSIKLRIIESLEDAEKCIFVSERLLCAAKEMGYSGNNSIVIPNGFDHMLFRPMDKDKIKKELGLKGNNIGFVGNLIPIKGADRLPLIFKNIYEKNKTVKFSILGNGYLREQIEKQCADFGLDVTFYGHVELNKVPYYMNSMDVLLLPSRNEGWPCVVLEALACNVPVVGSNNGGIPEAVSSYGRIVKEGENFEKRFSDAVIDILDNEILYDFQQHISKYTWDELGKTELSIINNLNIKVEKRKD